MKTSNTPNAVILIDPLSTGYELKEVIVQSGYKIIAIYTMTEEALLKSGKYISPEQRKALCEVVINQSDATQIIAQLKKTNLNIVGIIAGSEPGVQLADELAHLLHLRGNPFQFESPRRNKVMMRQKLNQAGLNNIDFKKCTELNEVFAFAKTHAYPLILKTPEGAGSHLVINCQNAQEAEQAFQQIIKQSNIFGRQADYALIEEFIQGTYYNFEIFSINSILHITSIWQINLSLQHPTVPIGIDLITSAQKIAELSAACEYVKSVAKALELQWGPGFIELKVDEQKRPVLIELGARLNGLMIPQIIGKFSNFDPIQATVDVFVGKDPKIPEKFTFNKEINIVFCPTEQSGTIEEINGLDDIQALPSYYDHKLFVKPHQSIQATYDLATLAIVVYLVHEDKTQIAKDKQAVLDCFKIKFKNSKF